jgi:riboflavin synthase
MLAFDVVAQTLALTTLGGLAPGQRVHLEPSATLATLLGGHLVQGHVDGVGTVASVRTSGEWRARITPPAHLMEYLAPQGSIAVQGVSLTLAAIAPPREAWFEIALIPTTLAKTTLGELRGGSRVNLECDVIAKHVVHWLKRRDA